MRIAALAIATLALGASASIGDRSEAYQECREQCRQHGCTSIRPIALRIMRWTCEADCAYLCTQAITDYALDPNEGIPAGVPKGRMVQFHGKWPFKRALGMQEPASVLFSVWNGIVHVQWNSRLRRELPQRTPYRQVYLVLPFAGIFAWICSAVFHARDTPLTEKFDYFAAGGSILLNLYVASLRLGKLGRRQAILLGGIFAAAFLAHCSYLSLRKFDYSYNMTANVSVALTHNLLWTAFAIVKWRTDPHYAQPFEPVLVLSAFMAAGALELFDFPPLFRAIDAHSLWHLSTVFINQHWYAYLLRDAQHIDSRNL